MEHGILFLKSGPANKQDTNHLDNYQDKWIAGDEFHYNNLNGVDFAILIYESGFNTNYSNSYFDFSPINININ